MSVPSNSPGLTGKTSLTRHMDAGFVWLLAQGVLLLSNGAWSVDVKVVNLNKPIALHKHLHLAIIDLEGAGLLDIV